MPRIKVRGEGVRTWVQPGFELFFSFNRVQTWVQLGFELLEEFELFQGLENSILNLGLIWVLIGFHSTWVQPGLNLDGIWVEPRLNLG